MRNIQQKVIKFIDQNSLIQKSDKLLIAFSGGPDSTFLIYFFNKFSKRFKIIFSAVYIDHQLRKESKEELLFCRKYCEKINIPFYSVKINVNKFAKEHKFSIEESARILRYKKLNELAKKAECNKIVFGHTKNDNTETILLNLVKGTGISGVSGIPIKRNNIIRPILTLSKEEILTYLQFNKIKYCLDNSNLNDDFERNFLRNKIIPQLKNRINPSLDESLLKSSILIQKESGLVNSIVEDLYKLFVRKDKSSFVIDLSISRVYDNIFLSEIFKKFLKSDLKIEISANIISSLIELTQKQKGKKIKLSSNYLAIKEDEKIIVKKETKGKEFNPIKIKIGQSARFPNGTIEISEIAKNEKFSKTKDIEYITGDLLKDVFILRNWHPGDKFVPLGMKGEKKISDFLGEQKIPNEIKKNQFVLLNNGQIIWVVNYRINDKFKIVSSTKRIIKLCVKQKQV
ncbi:MAG: tRNA lysidine(34) synthetase TilS [Ignavibacteriales bacterium]|nr:tRNA lysidine(34) synthetase TilS [Ignavibacteriales bacterium]